MDLFTSFVVPTLVMILFTVSFSLIYRKNSSHAKLPPGKFGWPIIGETLAWAITSGPERFIVDRMNCYSPHVFKTSLLGEKMAVICGPEGNRFVFSNENKLVKPWLPRSMVKIGLVNFDGDASEELKRRRGIFYNFLKREALRNHVHIMDSTVQRHLEEEWAPRGNLKVQPMAKKLVFSVVCQLFMGIEDPGEMAKLAELFGLLMDGVFSLPVNFPGTTFNRAVKAAKRMNSEIEEIIRRYKPHLSESNASNLLSHILFATDPDGKSSSDREIASIISGLLFASTDSTSTLLTSIVYYLADHRHVYDQVLREQQKIAHMKGENGSLTGEDTRRMRYSSNVVNEVLRLAPPGPGAFREAIDDITYAGFTIPKGWKIFWSLNPSHRDPKYFKNPDKFDPTRFEEDKPEPFSFTPFGGGPRMCPGRDFARQLALVFLHYLVIRFKWEKLDPNEKIVFLPHSKHPNGLPIKIQKHDSQPWLDA